MSTDNVSTDLDFCAPDVELLDNDVIAAMATSRSMRYLKSDPLPDAVLKTLMYAATRASNPANTQGWDFVVVRDADQKARFVDFLAPAISHMKGQREAATDEKRIRMLNGSIHLVENLRNVPAIVFVCGRPTYPPANPERRLMLSGCFSAAQNLIVAARSLGVGAVFSTLHLSNPDRNDEQAREILGLPDGVDIVATVPIGWPERSFGPVNRKPLEAVVHLDRYRAASA